MTQQLAQDLAQEQARLRLAALERSVAGKQLSFDEAIEVCQKAMALAAQIEPKKTHKYVEHHTYTGPGCAMCGKPLSEHGG